MGVGEMTPVPIPCQALPDVHSPRPAPLPALYPVPGAFPVRALGAGATGSCVPRLGGHGDEP